MVFAIVLTRCSLFHLRPKGDYHIASVENNVCKKLEKKVIMYCVFVDTKYTNSWTTFDIESALDSVRKAMNWIEDQADLSDIGLNIKVDYHQTKKKVVPIRQNFPRKTLSGTLLSVNGVKYLDRWADKIGKKVLSVYPKDTSTITATKVKPKDRERLLAKLRDIHKTDNVALVYFVNNYYTDEISVAVHTAQDDSPEYAVVSFKEPSVIAHEFLHLFGAWDLYITPYDNARKARKKKSFAMREFPDEIMAFADRKIESLEISPLTRYLIGWDDNLDPNYVKMIFNKKIRLAKY